MPRPSQRAAIIDAALHCFADRGFDATRVKHIAEDAGVAESALYRYFPSQDGIAQAFTGVGSPNLWVWGGAIHESRPSEHHRDPRFRKTVRARIEGVGDC
jgi:hypothetical protein